MRTKNEKKSIEIINFGKVSPNATDLEKSLLGTILLQSNGFDIVTDILKAECFYLETHQVIFRAMETLFNNNRQIELASVMNQLRSTEELDLIGGPYALTQLTSSTTTNIEYYARIIFEKYMQREVIRVSSESISKAYEDSCDAFNLVDNAEKEISGIINLSVKSYTTIGNEVLPVLNELNILRFREEKLTGIETGFTDINGLTCGWQAPDLIILAARPSTGKTALSLNLAMNAIKSGIGVGFFSLEMSKKQLIQRVLSAESGIPLNSIMHGKLGDNQMEMLYVTSKDFLNYKFMIDDKGSPTVYEIRNKVRKMYKAGARLIIIDYLQLMSGIQNGRSDNREQEISKISRDLKALCKELNVPIIALSQLSRAVESRAVKMPQLSDLRESGAIEQDADIVMFMYRPEYYGINVNENGDSMNGETHIRFAKHRNGALETVKLRANLATQLFSDFTESVRPIKLNGNFSPVNNYEKIDDELNPF